MNDFTFTFSDLISGYVTAFEWERKDYFTIKTCDDRSFEVKIGDNCYAEMLRNLGEAYVDCTGIIRDLLAPSRYVFVYGAYYPESDGTKFEAKHMVFLGRSERDYNFEQPDWWIRQITQLGDFYLKAQFEDGEVDYAKYRTHLTADGRHEDNARQETDTISRLVYGLASAYMLTGNERFLDAAEKGAEYLRAHFKCVEPREDLCYWYHAIDRQGKRIRKVFASEFGDDFDAIPAYEQIYALAGPTQTFRVTGDPAIEKDIQQTINLFQKYFLDHKRGGYFSHIDPVTFDGRAVSLGRNRARKNWNSIGDHAPAYLINAVLATGNPEWGHMLEYCADIITKYFPDYENSPFVNEKFHEDWSFDHTWGGQQNRAVVGHNLKIAWNLTRIQNNFNKPEYEQLSRRIAEEMPLHGMDAQRGGWYDMVERMTAPDERWHRFVWHDRKAWWQQEQGILAYQIMAGAHKTPEYLRLARESASFYNAWFLDHDAGGVYFNVLACGLPYMLGQEREKGSHSMSGYHSFELCFLAQVYQNLLINKHPLDLYFKPKPDAFKEGVLRVAPDMLPPGSVRIDSVTIDGEPHADFDANALTVQLPVRTTRVTVKVRVAPTSGLEHFSVEHVFDGDVAKLTLKGELDLRVVPDFARELDAVLDARRVALVVNELDLLCPEGARALMLAKQKMALDEDFFVVGAHGQVKELLAQEQFEEEITEVATYEELKNA